MGSSFAIAESRVVRESEMAALISLLADEDATVYHLVREKLLSLGVITRDWLHPHA